MSKEAIQWQNPSSLYIYYIIIYKSRIEHFGIKFFSFDPLNSHPLHIITSPLSLYCRVGDDEVDLIHTGGQ